jgi:hypothetical protein
VCTDNFYNCRYRCRGHAGPRIGRSNAPGQHQECFSKKPPRRRNWCQCPKKKHQCGDRRGNGSQETQRTAVAFLTQSIFLILIFRPRSFHSNLQEGFARLEVFRDFRCLSLHLSCISPFIALPPEKRVQRVISYLAGTRKEALVSRRHGNWVSLRGL